MSIRYMGPVIFVLGPSRHLPRGDTEHILLRQRGSVQEIFREPKILVQVHCSPKISAHFIFSNLCMNMKCSEIMQTEVRIASSEPRNIGLTISDTKKYHVNIPAVLFRPKNIADAMS